MALSGVADSVDQGWSPRICISHTLSGDASAGGRGQGVLNHSVRTTGSTEPLISMMEKLKLRGAKCLV